MGEVNYLIFTVLSVRTHIFSVVKLQQFVYHIASAFSMSSDPCLKKESQNGAQTETESAFNEDVLLPFGKSRRIIDARSHYCSNRDSGMQ